MKLRFLMIFIYASLLLGACGGHQSDEHGHEHDGTQEEGAEHAHEEGDHEHEEGDHEHEEGDHEHEEGDHEHEEDAHEHESGEQEVSLNESKTQALLDAYFALKDALVSTNSEEAQSSAGIMLASLKESDEAEIWTEVEVISNSTDVEEQRTQFKLVSEKVYNYVKESKSGEIQIYKQFCPMAFDNTGAFWLSNSKEILNPYFGDKMLHCGSVQEKL